MSLVRGSVECKTTYFRWKCLLGKESSVTREFVLLRLRTKFLVVEESRLWSSVQCSGVTFGSGRDVTCGIRDYLEN